VLGAEWYGWHVKKNLLVDPEGNATTQGQLRAYYYVYQLARELAKTDVGAMTRFQELLKAAG
jgi:hypothetical protein